MKAEPGKPHKDVAFERLSETGGSLVTAEAASMVLTRYVLAAEISRGQRVLELACAGGMGNGLLRECAASLVAGDVDAALLRIAAAVSPSTVYIARLDATKLPFASSSFDVVLCMECTYYIRDTDALFREIARVLAPRGRLLIVNANPRRPDFIISPLSIRYHPPIELADDLRRFGFSVGLWGAFPTLSRGAGALERLTTAVSRTLRRAASRLGVVPTTLQARARLKRLVHWRLTRLPPLLERATAPVAPLEALTSENERTWKVYYALADRGGAEAPSLPSNFHESVETRGSASAEHRSAVPR